LKVDDGEHPINFSQTFSLLQAGQSYFVHPLDTVDNNFAKVDSTGAPICIGAFQPITTAFSMLGHYDMILGMSFLRNAYTLLDYGTWIEGGTDQQSPFMQMLSVTAMTAARSNFVQVRLSGNDTINSDPRWALLPVSQMQHSPISAAEKEKMYQEMILSRWPYIFAGCFAFVLLVAGCCIWRCCKRRRARRAAKKVNDDKYGDVFSKDLPGQKSLAAKRQSYLPLGGGSTTELRAQYAQQPPLPYAATEPRQSAYSAQSSQWDDRQSNYSEHSLSQQHEGGYPQHVTYPPQRV